MTQTLALTLRSTRPGVSAGVRKGHSMGEVGVGRALWGQQEQTPGVRRRWGQHGGGAAQRGRGRSGHRGTRDKWQ